VSTAPKICGAGAPSRSPGARHVAVEQIRNPLEAETAELALPIIRTFEAKKLRTTGERRETRYLVRSRVARVKWAGIVSFPWRSQRPIFLSRPSGGLQRFGGKLRTPAMPAGITKFPLTLREIFLWQRPPSKFPPPGDWSPTKPLPTRART
jgi:hypothetical protein